MDITGNTFNKAYLDLLLDRKRWKLVCSQLPAEVSQISTRQHDKWLEKNSDVHPHREILLALKGNSLNSLNGTSYLCSPGALFLFDAFESHDRGYQAKAEKLDHLWMHIVEDKIAARVVLSKNNRIDYYGHDLIIKDKTLVSLLNESWDSIKETKLPNDLKREKIISVIHIIILALVEIDISDNEPEESNSYQEQTIEMICKHISRTSGKSLTIDKLARIAGYSKFHFLRLFKQHTGKSIHQFINQTRVTKVKYLLNKGQSKKEIAEKLGFSCASSFSHWCSKNLK